MDWAQWIIPLIVIAGWILKQLANNKVDAQRRQERAPAPQPAKAENPRERPMAAGRPPEEIRKFLEELRRKRPAQEARPAEREEEFTAQVVKPKRPPKPPPVPPPLPQPRGPVPRPSRPVIAEFAPATAPKISPPPPPSSTTSPVPVPAPAVAIKPITPAIRQLLDLIKDRQNLGTAFLLHEIFDGPRARKPRRRPPFV